MQELRFLSCLWVHSPAWPKFVSNNQGSLSSMPAPEPWFSREEAPNSQQSVLVKAPPATAPIWELKAQISPKSSQRPLTTRPPCASVGSVTPRPSLPCLGPQGAMHSGAKCFLFLSKCVWHQHCRSDRRQDTGNSRPQRAIHTAFSKSDSTFNHTHFCSLFIFIFSLQLFQFCSLMFQKTNLSFIFL